MSITPQEIRQQQFEKRLRGYDKEEVQAFLHSLSGEWEKVLHEQKRLRQQVEKLEKESEKLRDVEKTLYNSLKSAENTGKHIIAQAQKKASIHLEEVSLKIKTLGEKAKITSSEIIDATEKQSKNIIEGLETNVKNLEISYRNIVDKREDSFNKLKAIAENILGKIEKNKEEVEPVQLGDFTKKIKELKDQNSEINKTKKEFLQTMMDEVDKSITKAIYLPSQAEESVTLIDNPTESSEQEPKSLSFFDNVD